MIDRKSQGGNNVEVSSPGHVAWVKGRSAGQDAAASRQSGAERSQGSVRLLAGARPLRLGGRGKPRGRRVAP
ncbi:MAG TPA: hypothetical protein V6C71_19300 [Coleofasciculaceae cyanobacterium]